MQQVACACVCTLYGKHHHIMQNMPDVIRKYKANLRKINLFKNLMQTENVLSMCLCQFVYSSLSRSQSAPFVHTQHAYIFVGCVVFVRVLLYHTYNAKQFWFAFKYLPNTCYVCTVHSLPPHLQHQRKHSKQKKIVHITDKSAKQLQLASSNHQLIQQ